jgi:hypothetical protein
MGTPLATGLVGTELTVVHELRTLVLSRHAAIAVETAEEEGADALLPEVARETNLLVFVWTITHGLVRRPGSQAVYGTHLRELSASVPLSRSRAEDVERLRALARERFVPVK